MKKIVLLTLFACCLFSSLSAQDLDYLRKYDAKIEEFVIESTELGQKRQVLVYTPAHYEAESSYYNVLYVFDAQDRALFGAANGITHLLTEGSEDFIVVGIKATFIEEAMYTRNNDLIPSDAESNLVSKSGGNAEAFLAYVKNEVVPFIESNYLTLPKRTAIGHSLGASFLIYTLLNEPDLFDNTIAISPNLEYDDQRLVRGLENFDTGQFNTTKFLYLSHANEADAWPAWGPANQNAYRIVRESLVSDTFKAVIEEFPTEGHRSGFIPGITSAMRTYLDTIKPLQEMELSSETYEVTIRLKVQQEDDEVYITGNQEPLGNWEPGKVRMKKVAPLEREITLKVQDPVMVNFTRGTWESQLWIKEKEGFSNHNRIIRPENGAVYSYEVDSYSYRN